jgi:hypothetical protein
MDPVDAHEGMLELLLRMLLEPFANVPISRCSIEHLGVDRTNRGNFDNLDQCNSVELFAETIGKPKPKILGTPSLHSSFRINRMSSFDQMREQ